MADSLNELELSREEVEKLGEALKKEEFRKLLGEYFEEVQDPENRRRYQEEMVELEKQRGMDVTFINPTKGYVIKTSVDGDCKAFINVCSNEAVGKPTFNREVQNGSPGLNWSIPHTLSPPRRDYDSKRNKCQVFDVVFHPTTLCLAAKSRPFRGLVQDTACDSIESNFDVKLDRTNLKFPKLGYKGAECASVIRKPNKEPVPELSGDDKEVVDRLFANAPHSQKSPPKKPPPPKKFTQPPDNSKYASPKFVIKHRTHVELEDFTRHKTAKLNSAIPKELVVEVNLPLLRSSADIALDVVNRTLQLTSEKPAKYKLNLTLPYEVVQDRGSAKFDKDKKTLIVTLPVKRHKSMLLTDVSREDSGVESDHGSPPLSSPISEIESVPEQPSQVVEKSQPVAFLRKDLHYSVPEFSCHSHENLVAFTLNIKNADERSIEKLFPPPLGSSLHLKFATISSSFYFTHYAFYLKLPASHTFDPEELSTEVWDNNVVVQLQVDSSAGSLTSYFVGVDENDLKEMYMQEPSIINQVLEAKMLKGNRDKDVFKVESETTTGDEVESQSEKNSVSEDDSNGAVRKGRNKSKGKSKTKHKKTKARNAGAELELSGGDNDTLSNLPQKPTRAIDILNSYSESSVDELSCSSPTRSRGILKCIQVGRRFTVRSVSESNLDDYSWPSSSIENGTSLESVIPEEEGRMSTSLKKTVRFNDVISKQLFRLDSSILGQKKKNKRKSEAKKRAQERRHSESEFSGTEEVKGGESEATEEEDEAKGNENVGHESISEKGNFNGVFEIDM